MDNFLLAGIIGNIQAKVNTQRTTFVDLRSKFYLSPLLVVAAPPTSLRSAAEKGFFRYVR